MKKQKTEKLKTNKGITLIALVITIIVMLILVAVTISMAVNGGLFEYAKNAGTQTNAAVANEQELANLEAGMTVDQLIDKYTGKPKPVDPKLLNIGDYVKYPVEYSNVATLYDDTGAEEGGYPRDKFTGWRVLAKETDEQGNVLYVKLISAGVPLSFCHYEDADICVRALTTNFLTTEITNTLTHYKFYKCGFTNITGATLEEIFTNKFTDKVQSLTKDELDEAAISLGGSTIQKWDYVIDPKYKDLLAVPCKGGGIYAPVWLGTRESMYDLFAVSSNGDIEAYGDTTLCLGVRAVVTLKNDVQFTPATKKINETTTWEIDI